MKLKRPIASQLSGRKSANAPKAGTFSVVAGASNSLAAFGTPFADAKCRGECTCRCCKK